MTINPHPFIPSRKGKACQLCGGWADHSDHNRELWTGSDHEREAARQLAQADEMTAKMREPLKDVSRATGILERESTLFYGTGANPALF